MPNSRGRTICKKHRAVPTADTLNVSVERLLVKKQRQLFVVSAFQRVKKVAIAKMQVLAIEFDLQI